MVAKRAAFTFIELVFAIVIISVVVLSLPKMTAALNKTADTNLVQEAIFAAATELNEVTTKHWDENSMDLNASPFAYVINLDGTCEANQTSSRYRLRSGHILEPYHRKCLSDLTLGAADTNTNDNVDAVEDSAHTTQKVFLNSSASAAGYKDEYNSSVAIGYSPHFNGVDADANLKKITVTIKKSDNTVLAKLRAYVANIGEVDYYKRSF